MATQTIQKNLKPHTKSPPPQKQKILKENQRQLPHRKLHNALESNPMYQKKTSLILTYHL